MTFVPYKRPYKFKIRIKKPNKYGYDAPIFIVLKDKQNRTMASNYASTSYKQCNVFYGRSMRKGVTIREMVGHADERTTMNSYCYDRHTEDERRAILERALSS